MPGRGASAAFKKASFAPIRAICADQTVFYPEASLAPMSFQVYTDARGGGRSGRGRGRVVVTGVVPVGVAVLVVVLTSTIRSTSSPIFARTLGGNILITSVMDGRRFGSFSSIRNTMSRSVLE